LRHDPDVIFISELRDAVAMRNVMAHASAGHLVKSTLHTQNPLMIIARLVAAGVSPKVLLTPNVLRAGIGCMLMPVLCKSCKIEHHQLSPERRLASKDLFATYGDRLRFKGEGCAECNHKGVIGVRPCLQIVEFDVDIIDCLIREDYSTALALWLGFGDDAVGIRGISMRNVACMGVLNGEFDALDAFNKVDGFDDSKDFPNKLRVLRAQNAATLGNDKLADAETLDLQDRFKRNPLSDLESAV
jgi:type II secretory ATPase GspE/PulE/Tfp pilus assembly ATPase PilB-like protein